MKILVLNGSPRPNGNTAAMVSAFADGAVQAGHEVTVIDIRQKKIAGCLACEYCHGKGEGVCIQKDDMQEIYPLIDQSDMIVFATPVYYFAYTAQMQAAVNRFYPIGSFAEPKKAALFLSSASPDVYDGAVYAYRRTCEFVGMEDLGIFTAYGPENKNPAKLEELRAFGRGLA
jgi:multimeric flavodoxin WrbA